MWPVFSCLRIAPDRISHPNTSKMVSFGVARSENRNYQRHRRRLRLRFRTDKTWKRSFARDVSVTGLFVNSNTVPAENEVEIEVTLPNATVVLSGKIIRGLRAPARLQRVAKAGFAVKLLAAPPEWLEYCRSLEK